MALGYSVVMTPDIILKLSDFYNRPLVYGLKRDNIFIYIGKTVLGLARISQHDAISRKIKLEPNDTIEAWFTSDPDKLEITLIKLHKPKYNTVHNNSKELYIRNCSRCRAEFKTTNKSRETCNKCYEMVGLKYNIRYKRYLRGEG